jgi:small subunit ribosomal protein S4
MEKQKIRFNYGLGERQLRRLVSDARRSQLSTGDKLMELLERRLDNVVFRAGFTPTIPAARQLVNHGHILVNGRKASIPSYRVRVGEVISFREKSRNLECVEVSLENPTLNSPEWLDINRNQRTAAMAVLPTIESVPFPFEIQLIVEHYAQLI